ncbi:PPC domain-containing protein [Faucicola mancuniensis]|uniref:PPC domain-containing protein n=1 Tax=Faucicola mancuniensis TaxID=1309795 RepID=UPI003977AEC1
MPSITGKVYLIINKLNAAFGSATDFNIRLTQTVKQTKPLMVDQEISGQFNTASDQDNYQFQVSQAGYYQLTQVTASNSNIRFELLNPDGTLLFSHTNLATLKDSQVYLNPGNYIFKISNTIEANSQYSFKLINFVPTISLSHPIDLTLENNKSKSVTLSNATDTFYYRLMLANEDTLTINDDSVSVTLLDKNGNEIASSADGNFTQKITSTDVYNLAIKSTVAISEPKVVTIGRSNANVNTATEVSNTIANAQEVLVALNATKVVPVNIGDNNTTTDVDFYRVYLVKGEILKLSTPNGTFDGYARVFNATGSEVSRVDDSPLDYTASATGVYYIGISGYPNASYNPIDNTNLGNGRVGTLQLSVSRVVNNNLNLLPSYTDIVMTSDDQAINNWQGSINANEFKVFKLAVEETGLYYLDNKSTNWYSYNNYQQIVLADETGKIVTTRLDQPVELNKGNYQLIINQGYSYNNVSEANFALSNLTKLATPISLGQASTTENQIKNQVKAYVFDAQAGDEIYFNILGNTNGSTAWRIINAHG